MENDEYINWNLQDRLGKLPIRLLGYIIQSFMFFENQNLFKAYVRFDNVGCFHSVGGIFGIPCLNEWLKNCSGWFCRSTKWQEKMRLMDLLVVMLRHYIKTWKSTVKVSVCPEPDCLSTFQDMGICTNI